MAPSSPTPSPAIPDPGPDDGRGRLIGSSQGICRRYYEEERTIPEHHAAAGLEPATHVFLSTRFIEAFTSRSRPPSPSFLVSAHKAGAVAMIVEKAPQLKDIGSRRLMAFVHTVTYVDG